MNLVQEHVNRNGNNVFRASYVCEKCGASVGIHSGGKFPMGKMATKEMREMRYKIHRLLEEFNFTDKEWGKYYKHTAGALGVKESKAHMGMLKQEQLRSWLDFIEELTLRLTKKEVRAILLG